MQGTRKINNFGSTKVIGNFVSLKMGETIWWESPLERDFIYHMEYDKEVLRYIGQPFQIPYFIDKPRHYTPDFLAEYTSGAKIVYEVKPEAKINQQKNQAKFKHARDYCEKHGMQFQVVSEKTIRIKPLLENLKLLYRYARVKWELEHILTLQRYFSIEQEIELKRLRSETTVLGVPYELLLCLIYHGYLHVDLDTELNESSLIRPANLYKVIDNGVRENG